VASTEQPAWARVLRRVKWGGGRVEGGEEREEGILELGVGSWEFGVWSLRKKCFIYVKV
jgi:hypothetical protein